MIDSAFSGTNLNRDSYFSGVFVVDNVTHIVQVEYTRAE